MVLAFIDFGAMSLPVLAAAMFFGAAFLLFGGDRLTVAARSFGASLGLPGVVIDVVVTSVATSVPLMVTSLAALKLGYHDVATGSIVGSVVACVCLVMGVCACIWPGPVDVAVGRRDMSILLGAAMLFSFFGYEGLTLQWYEGLVLVVAGLFFMGFQLWQAFKRARESGAAELVPEMAPVRALLWVVGSMVAIVAGAFLLAGSSVSAAAAVGLDGVAAGTTVVALGATLPILLRALSAGRSGNVASISGCIVTATIFNLLFASGVASFGGYLLFMPIVFHVELPAMFGGIILLWLLMRTRSSLDRMEGAVLVVTYAALMYAAIRGSM